MEEIVERLDAEKMKRGFSTVCFPEGPVYVLYGNSAKKFERLREDKAELLKALTDLWAVSHWADNPYEMDAAKLALAKAKGGE